MLSDSDGMVLFDAALAAPAELAVPMRLDLAAMRAGPIHPIMRHLVAPTPAPRPGATASGLRSAGRPATRATREGGVLKAPCPRERSERQQAHRPQPAQASLLDRLTAVEPARRRDVLLAVIGEQTAAILPGFEAGHLDADTGFAELGFDSLTAVELRNRLDQATGLRLPVTLVFDQATGGALAGHLLGLLADRIPAAPATPAAANAGARNGDDPWAALFDPEGLATVGAIADLGGAGGQRLGDLAAEQGGAVVHPVPVDPDAALPGTYDLVVALDGLATVRRKRDLLARVDAALIDGGRLLLADHVGTLRGDLDDRAAGVLVPSVDSWVALLGSARLVIEQVDAPPGVLEPRLDHPGLAEPRRRGWARPALLRLRKSAARSADDRDRANHRALTEWAGA